MTQVLTRSIPEAQGMASSAILDFIAAVEASIHDMHSLMLVRHGHVIAEGWWAPYAPELTHVLFSLSKSFTSTAVGLAVAEGRLTVDDPVIAFFPDETPKTVSDNLSAMQVRHLLSMSTGHDEDTTRYLRGGRNSNWIKAFLARPVEHEPGTHFLYNSGASFMLSAIVQKLTGMTVLDYLGPRFFEPLGIEGATWDKNPQGINVGGWGLNVKTEDIAKLGQLYLQKGVWGEQRILPEAWVTAATSAQIDNAPNHNTDWEQGYGYQFWRCRHDAYRGDGAFGQYCIVMPDQDAVLAITSGVGDMQAVLDLVWNHLLPAMKPEPLPTDPFAAATLADTLADLALAPQPGKPSSPVAARVSGQTFVFEPNDQGYEAIAFDFGKDGAMITMKDARDAQTIPFGSGVWIKTTAVYGGLGTQRIATSGAWTAEDTYVLKMWLYETPFCNTTTCRFDGETVTVLQRMNVGFGPKDGEPLVGNVQTTEKTPG